jgi:hypothetical protein
MTYRTLARSTTTATLLAACLVSPSASQVLRPASVEVNAGPTFGGSTGHYFTGTGLSLDALVALRPGVQRGGGFVLAVSGSAHALGVRVECDAVPGVPCAQNFPEFWLVSALAGWQTRNGGARILIGPAVVGAESHQAGAAQARLELATPLLRQLSLLASARMAYIPSYRGEAFRLGAVGIGLRLR